MYRSVLSRKADKALRKIPTEYLPLLNKAIKELAKEPRPQQTIKLSGEFGDLYRHRVGHYRIFYSIDDNNKVIEILRIERRTTTTYQK